MLKCLGIFVACGVVAGFSPLLAGDVQWKRLNLDKAFRSEGVAAFDVNQDGKIDVVAGDVWYEAPNWIMHEIRTPGTYFPAKGYSQSFCNFGCDVNGDGWIDLICVGFPGESFNWYENPRNAPGHWKAHPVWHSACNETPLFLDITGEGKPALVMGSQPESQMGYLPVPGPGQANNRWTFLAISKPGDPKKQGMDTGSNRFYHGLGVGDFNGDGHPDVLIREGWWEGPANPAHGPWAFHPYKMVRVDKQWGTECANIYADDLDLDGDQDLISSSAHAFGVWWWENVDGKTMRQHVIDKSFSQTHALLYVDINGDGVKDLVTGKRYFAHMGHDPGDYDPVVMCWYEIKKSKGSPPKFVRHEIVEGRDTGIGTQFQIADVNGDGRPDIVLSNKKGVNVLVQK